MENGKIGLYDKKVIILGAGLSGLSAGWALLNLGATVKILEKEPYCGGICHTFRDDGYYFDLGPHFIHTNKEHIRVFLKKIIGENLEKKKPKVYIYFNRHFVKYPIRGINVLKALDWKWAFLTLVDFIYARIRMFFKKDNQDNSFRDWLINRFGRVLYNIYFGPYAQKAWKIPDKEISSYVAKRRVPVVRIRDYIRAFLRLKRTYSHPEDTSLDVYYPRYGIGQISDHLEKYILEKGGEIYTNSKVLEIIRNGVKVESIVYEKDNVRESLPCDYLLSTLPLGELTTLIKPSLLDEIILAGSRLDYCSEKILYIKIKKPSAFNSPLMYFQDPRLRFNRVYDLGAYSASCAPQGKGAICVEFTCSYEDAIWNAPDSELFGEVMSFFGREGFLFREDVSGYLVKCIEYAYPRFRIGYEDRLNKIFDYLGEIRNMVTFGRQGLFCYANADEAIDMAFRAVEYLGSSTISTMDYNVLFKEYCNYSAY